MIWRSSRWKANREERGTMMEARSRHWNPSKWLGLTVYKVVIRPRLSSRSSIPPSRGLDKLPPIKILIFRGACPDPSFLPSPELPSPPRRTSFCVQLSCSSGPPRNRTGPLRFQSQINLNRTEPDSLSLCCLLIERNPLSRDRDDEPIPAKIVLHRRHRFFLRAWNFIWIIVRFRGRTLVFFFFFFYRWDNNNNIVNKKLTALRQISIQWNFNCCLKEFCTRNLIICVGTVFFVTDKQISFS